MAGQVHSGAPVLRKTDDHAAIRTLALRSGLEDGTFEDIVMAYGCYIGEELVGCAALKRDGDRFAVEWLAVADGFRRKGMGRMLVGKIEAEARMRGADRIWALARTTRFFEHLGFRVTTSEEAGGPAMSNCLLCSQYQRTCFPAIVTKQL